MPQNLKGTKKATFSGISTNFKNRIKIKTWGEK